MDIKAKLVKAFDSGKLKATFDVTLDNAFVVQGHVEDCFDATRVKCFDQLCFDIHWVSSFL